MQFLDYDNTNINSKDYYWMIKIRMIFMALVIIGALNWGAVSMGYNFVDSFTNFINNLFKSTLPINTIIYLLVGVSGLLLIFNRNTWLPFLGKSVLPDSLIPLKNNTISDEKIIVNTKPNSKIAYWASLPSNGIPDVEKAYGNYSNSGVVMSDASGKVELPILKGTDYIVPSGRKIERHIHYRVLGLPYGMIGKVETVKY